MRNRDKWQMLWDKANARCKQLFAIWANAEGFSLNEWENYSRAFRVRQYIFDRQLKSE
jgi:hypothetical protein